MLERPTDLHLLICPSSRKISRRLILQFLVQTGVCVERGKGEPQKILGAVKVRNCKRGNIHQYERLMQPYSSSSTTIIETSSAVSTPLYRHRNTSKVVSVYCPADLAAVAAELGPQMRVTGGHKLPPSCT